MFGVEQAGPYSPWWRRYPLLFGWYYAGWSAIETEFAWYIGPGRYMAWSAWVDPWQERLWTL